jgi:hypothetical protein
MYQFLKMRSYAIVLGIGAGYLYGFDWKVAIYLCLVVWLVNWRSA